MNNKKLMQTAVITALVTVLGMLVHIPLFNGLVTLADAGIFASALLLGGRRGAFIGGVSCFFIDILSGFPQWALISLLVHGLQGYLVGKFGHQKPYTMQVVSLFLGSLVMILGYFVAESLMFNVAAGFTALFGNALQEVFGAAVSVFFVIALKKTTNVVFE